MIVSKEDYDNYGGPAPKVVKSIEEQYQEFIDEMKKAADWKRWLDEKNIAQHFYDLSNEATRIATVEGYDPDKLNELIKKKDFRLQQEKHVAEIEDYVKAWCEEHGITVKCKCRDNIWAGKKDEKVDLYEISLCYEYMTCSEIYFDFKQNNWWLNGYWYKIDMNTSTKFCVYPELHFGNEGQYYYNATRYSPGAIKERLEQRFKKIEGFLLAYQTIQHHHERIKKLTQIKCSVLDQEKYED